MLRDRIVVDSRLRGWAFLLLTILLCTPSYLAWFQPDFFLGEREFDWWMGSGPSIVSGRAIHSILFLLLGALFVDHVNARRIAPRWLPVSLILAYALAAPWVSPDVTFYLAEGWLQSHYGADPYVVSMLEIDTDVRDPIFRSVAKPIRPIVGNYGALFQELSALVSRIAGGNPIFGVFIFKALCITALAFIVRQTSLLAEQSGGDREFALLVFVYNPLMLFNVAAAAHNDILFLVPLVIALRMLDRSPSVSGFLIGVCVGLKLFALFLIPVWVVAIARTPGRSPFREPTRFVLAALVGWIGSFLPNVSSAEYVWSWVRNENAFLRASIHLVAEPIVDLMAQRSEISSMLIGKVVFIGLSLAVIIRNHFKCEREGIDFVARTSFEVLLLMQVLVLYMMNEWYLLWPALFASVIVRNRPYEWLLQTGLLVMPAVIWAIQGNAGVVISAQTFLMVVYVSSVALQLWQYWTGRPARYSLSSQANLVGSHK